MSLQESERKMRVYLDNCCYNRPFDEQAQLSVRLETEAKLEVQRQMRSGELEYVWSDMLVTEVQDSQFWERQEIILAWANGASEYVITTPEVECRAEELMALGLKTADAIHLASAEAACCDWFFTVDKGILKKVRNIGSMRVANPLEYVQEVDV